MSHKNNRRGSNMNKALRLVLLASGLATLVASQAFAADTFKVRFSWKLKGEYAPLYVARDMGAFEKANLDVSMGEGAGAPAALTAMLQGQEDAVVIPAAFALTAISKGMPIKIVALYHPKAPIGFVSFAQNPVREPKDMEGKKFAVSVGDTVAAYLPVFCRKNNVDCDKINKINVNPQVRNSQFMAHQIDVIGAYLNVDLPLMEPISKEKFVVLDLASHGMVVPGLSVVVADTAIAQKPEVIARFIAALGEGVSASRKDPAKAAAVLKKDWPGSPSVEVITRQVVETLDAIPNVPGHKTGWTDAVWITEALDMLKSVGEIDDIKPLPTYYTNALVEK
jgi:NitT/TauT family transport system substrate-binding protein